MFFLSKKQLYRGLDQAIDQVKHGIYRRLIKEYTETMDGEEAGFLAAAVTNRLFSLPPANRDAKLYLEQNEDKVRKAAINLQGNKELLEPVNLGLQHRRKILFELLKSGKLSGAAIDAPIDNLKRMGLFMDPGELPDLRKFLKYARKFLQKSPD